MATRTALVAATTAATQTQTVAANRQTHSKHVWSKAGVSLANSRSDNSRNDRNDNSLRAAPNITHLCALLLFCENVRVAQRLTAIAIVTPTTAATVTAVARGARVEVKVAAVVTAIAAQGISPADPL